MADINVNVVLPDPISVDVTSPTQALATNVSIPGPQGPAGIQGPSGVIGPSGAIGPQGPTGVVNTGQFDLRYYSITNPSGFITGVNLSNYATTSNLALTGSNLENKISSLSGTLTGNYLTTNSASSTYATISNLNSTGSTLNSNINSLSGTITGNYVTKSNGQFINRPTVNGTGVLLSGEAASLPTTILYTTGNQIKSGRLIIGDDAISIVDPNSIYTLSLQTNSPRTWLEILNNSGANKGVFFGIEGNDFEQYNWQAGDIKFFTSENFSNGTERLRIKNDGKVGIGTSSPSEKLEVSGNIKASGASFIYRPTVNGTGVLLSGDIPYVQTNSYFYVDATRTDSYIENGNILYPYKTLSGAYNAAKNIASFHNPTYITLLSPIAENLTIDKGYINLIGNNTNKNDPIRITGSLVFAATGIGTTATDNNFSIGGLGVTATSNNKCILFSGNNPQRLFIQDCWLIAKDNGTCLYSNNTNTTSRLQGDILKFSPEGVNTTAIDIVSGTSSISFAETSSSASVLAYVRNNSTLNISNSQIETSGAKAFQVENAARLTLLNSVLTNTANPSTGIFLKDASSTAVVVGSAISVPANANSYAINGVAYSYLFYKNLYFSIDAAGQSTESKIGNNVNKNLINSYDPVVYSIGDQTISGIKTFDVFPVVSGNKLITGVDLSSYATITNLASTGSTLTNSINSLSGTLTSTYATITNLVSTGSTLQTNIDNLSGYINSSGSNILFTTGSQTINGFKTFNTGISFILPPTGTGIFGIGPYINITGSLASGNLFTGISINLGADNSTNAGTNRLISARVGGSDRFVVRSDGQTTIGGATSIQSSISTNNNINMTATTPTIVMYAGGSQNLVLSPDNISGNLSIRNGANPTQLRVFNRTGTNTGEFGLFGWRNNELIVGPQQTTSGALRDLTLTGANININASGDFNIFDNTNILGNLNVTGNILLSGNQVLTGSSTLYATSENLASTGSTLNSNINSLSGTLTGNYLTTSSASSTYATITNLASTGSTLNTRINNLSGYINSTSSNIVFTTGNQTISGVKSFAQDTVFGDSAQGDFLVISGNNFTVYGSGNFTSGLFVNGNAVLTGNLYATAVNLASTGSTLDNKINNLSGVSVLTFGNQTINGLKTFTSGIDLNNSKLINATPDLLNVSANFNITGTQNSRVILANSPTIITGSIVSGNPIGFNTSIIQISSGQVLITGIGSNVIVNSYNNQFRTAAQYATISILHTGNDGYIMYGNTST